MKAGVGVGVPLLDDEERDASGVGVPLRDGGNGEYVAGLSAGEAAVEGSGGAGCGVAVLCLGSKIAW